MSTTIRPEVSVKNEYWIDRHRYYELKHFCLQYPVWKKAYAGLDGLSKRPPAELDGLIKTNHIGDPTARCAQAKASFAERIDMVERAAEQTSSELARYIIKAVTEGFSYNYLSTKLEMPCCKEVYYKLYRRFFWLLNKERR